MHAEIDAFSGRPNPRWELTGNEAAEFQSRLRALKATAQRTEAFEGLGYRGVVVKPDDDSEVRIYRGEVTVSAGGRDDVLQDPARSLERWILESARGHVEQPVLEYVLGEVNR